MADHSYFAELIAAAVDGEISPAERAEMNDHLAVCPRCRAFRDAMEAVVGVTAKHLPPPPADFTARVMDSVRAQAVSPAKKKRKKLGILPFPARTAALAAMAAIALWAGFTALGSLKMGRSGGGESGSAIAYNGGEVPVLRSEDNAARDAVSEGVEGDVDGGTVAPMEPSPTQESAAHAAGEDTAVTEMVEDTAEAATPVFCLYAGEDTEAVPLLASGDEDLLALLLTVDKPAQPPDREADYTLVYMGEDGTGQTARLWEDRGALILDGETGTGWSVSAARLREILQTGS